MQSVLSHATRLTLKQHVLPASEKLQKLAGVAGLRWVITWLQLVLNS